MFHVFAFTYYILLRCVTREYSMTSVLLRDDIAIPFLLERYMKHVFVAGLVTGDLILSHGFFISKNSK